MTTRHIYLVLKGSYSATNLAGEVWQCGMRFRVTNTPAAAFGNMPSDTTYDDESIARDETNWTIEGNYSVNLAGISTFRPDDWLNDNVAGATSTFLAATNYWQNKVQVDSIVAYGMQDGEVAAVGAGPAKVELTFKAGHKPVGASATASLPPQASIVASWETAVAGRHGKGRIYLPAPTTAVLTADGGLLTSTVQTGVAAAAADYVAALNYSGIGADSYADMVVAGAPWLRYAKVSSVRIGNVIDTQRRRRNRLTETYISNDV